MAARTTATARRIVPLTPACWPQLEQLFGTKGACAGCWCMWMRLPLAEFKRLKGERVWAAPCFFVKPAHRSARARARG